MKFLFITLCLMLSFTTFAREKEPTSREITTFLLNKSEELKNPSVNDTKVCYVLGTFDATASRATLAYALENLVRPKPENFEEVSDLLLLATDKSIALGKSFCLNDGSHEELNEDLTDLQVTLKEILEKLP